MNHKSDVTTGESSLVRQMVKSTSYYTLAAIVQRSTSILMLPLYTRYLTRADYGVLELLDLVLTIATLLVSVQLSTALFYYYHHAGSEIERRREIVSGFFGTVLMGTAVGVAGCVFAPTISQLVFNSTAYEALIRIVLIGLGFSLPVEFGFAFLRLRDKAQAFVRLAILRVLANVTLNAVFLIALGFGVSTMPWSSLITTCCLALIFARVTLAENSPSLFHVPTLWKMAIYGLPLVASTTGEFFLHFGDRLFLSKAVSLADLGLYGLAYKLGMVVPFATTPFFNYWNSQMVGIVRRPQGDQTYARGATYLLLGQMVIVLLLTLFIDPVMAIMVESKFRGAAVFVPWIALAYLVRGMGIYWTNTFLLLNRPALVAKVTWVGAGSCLLAYALLIPKFGLWGAVTATYSGFALMSGFALWKGQQLRPFRYEYTRWCKILLAGALAALPYVLFRPSGMTIQIVLGLVCFWMFPIFLWFSRFPTEGETQYFTNVLRKLIHKPIAIPSEGSSDPDRVPFPSIQPSEPETAVAGQ